MSRYWHPRWLSRRMRANQKQAGAVAAIPKKVGWLRRVVAALVAAVRRMVRW